MSFYDKWLPRIGEVIDRIKATQLENIDRAAHAIANSIISGHVCFLFGAGHSIMPVIEIYPRYGGIVGFMPILELPLSYFTRVVGDLGFLQFDLLEGLDGYGKTIMENYVVHKEDSIIIFSNSGASPVVVDVALAFKEKDGGTSIAVTSIVHSKSSESAHSSGKKLHEVTDIVVDTGAPAGDVVVPVPTERGEKIALGPTSAIASLVVADLIQLRVAEIMFKKGHRPMINPVRRFDPRADEIMKDILREYSKRLRDHIGYTF